jgi:hypothetical protein
MTLAKKPTEVRLQPDMVDDFKRQIRIAQSLQGPEAEAEAQKVISAQQS